MRVSAQYQSKTPAKGHCGGCSAYATRSDLAQPKSSPHRLAISISGPSPRCSSPHTHTGRERPTGSDKSIASDNIMRRLRREDAEHDEEADEGSRPRKQRKQRPCYSCAGKSANGVEYL